MYRTLTGDDRPEKVDSEPAYEWSDEEIEGLLAASVKVAAERDSKYDYSPILRTAVYTGLRLGELLGLQWHDIDLDAGVLRVRRQFTLTGELTEPKTKKGLRRVPLRSTAPLFRSWEPPLGPVSDIWFAKRTAEPSMNSYVSLRFVDRPAEHTVPASPLIEACRSQCSLR